MCSYEISGCLSHILKITTLLASSMNRYKNITQVDTSISKSPSGKKYLYVLLLQSNLELNPSGTGLHAIH